MISGTKRMQEEAMRVLMDRLSPIVPYLEDSSITEVMINSHESIFIERGGVMQKLQIKLPHLAIDAAIRAIMAINAKDTSYIMDARLPGLRIAAAVPPVALHGPMMTIRKHASTLYELDDFVRQGSFNKGDVAIEIERAEEEAMESGAAFGGQGLADFLKWAIRSKKNLLIAGGTGSGKTTLLSSCLAEIPDSERIITCEDTNEILLKQSNIVQFEAYVAPNSTPITIRDLIRICLRSRPDRIIVGEIRGAEAYDFLDAMNTGHAGSLCTLHADSAFLALRRLESLIRMSPTASNLPLVDMRGSIASAIDYVLHQSREEGVRAPQKVIKLKGINDETGDYLMKEIYSKY